MTTNNEQNEQNEQNKVECTDAKDLFQKIEERAKQGAEITKIYNQPRRGIFSFFFKPKK